MSQIYNTFKDRLWSWAKNSTGPANVKLKMVAINNTYTWDASHNDLADIGSAVVATSLEISGAVMNQGVLDAGDVSFAGITTGPVVAGYVVYLDWTSGTQLVCFIDESTDGSLPYTIASPNFGVRFSSSGICRI